MVTQLMVNGLAAGSAYALVALGFSLVYAVTRFFHFAHGAVYTCGAYFTFALAVLLGVPLWAAIAGSVLLSSLLGVLIELGVYRPLRKKYASSLVLLLASFGIYIVIQNIISLAFGDDIKTVRAGEVREGISILGARITPIQIGIIGTSIVLFVCVSLLMHRTRMGKAMRAVACDPELALISGIDSGRVILFAFGLGSALAGIAAILIAFDTDMVPTMGMQALLMGVVATIVGGVGSIAGAAFGGLFLGLAMHLGIWQISAQWQNSIAFLILLAFLLLRPQGIFGRKLAKAEV